MSYREELEAHNELERADGLLGSVRRLLIGRIEELKAAGDAAGVQRHEEQYAEVQADAKKLRANREYRKTILARYPVILGSLK